MHVVPGQHLLGRYTTVERLGTGGMGEVWRATDDVTGQDVALKFLARHLVADENARERFRREAQHAGSLSHDHVVEVFDGGTDDDAMILVMEVVEGGTLAERLSGNRWLPIDTSLRLGEQILKGLSAAHDGGLVHRDIKPSNVMFASDDHVKLTDFGIARLSASDTSRTAEVYGSAPYLAPERAEGHVAGPESDVYAVGCILYEMLTGISPYVGETPAVTIARHLSYDPPPPSTHIPAIDAGVDAVVKRSLTKDPADRYRDAGEMLADLRRAAAEEPLAAATVALSRPLSLSERRTVATHPESLLPIARPPTTVNIPLTVAGVAAVALAVAVVVWLA